MRRISVWAILFVIVLLCVSPYFAAAQDAGSTGQIAFLSDRDGTSNIFIMGVDGSQPTNLTNSAVPEDLPVWSPDGQWITFTRNVLGDIWDVFSIAPDGSQLAQLTDGETFGSNVRWSPDGTQLVFEAEENFNPSIFIMNADGSDRRPLVNGAEFISSPDWSPDGARVAFSGDGLVSFDLASGAEQALTQTADLVTNPLWSPDGQQIAYMSMAGGDDWELFVMNADGSSATQLTENDVLDATVAWSPDGQQIAFTRVENGTPDVYVMNADGSDLTRLTDAGGQAPVWSPDGSQIAFITNRDGNFEIYVMNADGSNQVNLTNDPAGDYGPTWQPQGGAVVVPPAPEATESAELTEAPEMTSAEPTEAPEVATAEPAEAPTDEPVAVPCSVTASSNVNLRGGPGTDFAIAGTLAAGQSADADGQNQAADGFTWYRLTTGSWLRSDLVAAADCSELATVEP